MLAGHTYGSRNFRLSECATPVRIVGYSYLILITSGLLVIRPRIEEKALPVYQFQQSADGQFFARQLPLDICGVCSSIFAEYRMNLNGSVFWFFSISLR